MDQFLEGLYTRFPQGKGGVYGGRESQRFSAGQRLGYDSLSAYAYGCGGALQ